MKILQVLPELGTGGVERTTVDVARALLAAGHTPHAASAGGPMTAGIEIMGGVHHTLPLKSKNPFVWRKTAKGLAQIIRENDIDIVHVRSRAPARPALWAARKTGVKFLTTYHGIYNASSALKRRYNSVMARGDLIIANSEYTKAHIIKEHGTAADKIIAIPRGVDLAQFTLDIPAERIAAIRAHWGQNRGGQARSGQDRGGMSADERVLLLPGRLTRWKGQDVAIKAMSGITDLTLVIQGDAQGRQGYVDELKALIEQSDARILIAPPHADMAAAYAASFGALSASTDPEAFGRVTAEACAMGVPMIATQHGGSLEILDGGAGKAPLGLFALPGDAAHLHGQIQTLAAMRPDHAKAFASGAQARARSKFTNQAMCAATLDVYRTLLSE